MKRLALLLLTITLAATVAGQTHPFNVDDLVTMKRISDPQPSPDGKWIVYTLRETDLDANRGRTDLWLMPADGSTAPKRLTSNSASDHSARWSSEGTIFFLSSRSGSSQVWTINPRGGEATQVTDLALDVSNLVVAPDGKTIAFTAAVFPEMSIEETAKAMDDREAKKASGVIHDSLFVRHWDTWKDGTRSHLFVMSPGADAPVDVTSGYDADVPSMPFGGAEEITFTPDSKSVVFTMRDVGAEEPWSTDFDLYLAPIDGSARPVDLTDANRAWDTGPSFSPDGQTLAYLAMARPGYESDRFRIMLRSWPDGETKTLTEGWDRSPGSIVWSSDGRTIYATAGNLGQNSLFAIDVKSGEVRTIRKDGTVRSPAVLGSGKNERIVFGMDDLRHPVDLYSIRPDGKDMRKLTSINADALATIELGEPEQFTFAGWNDETVYAYIVKPVNFDPAKSYPIAFLIHGGPQGSFGNDFHYRWNPQTYAAAGYAAIMIDFHGSTGYGQEFTDSIRGDWGGKPLVDLQKGLDAALDRYKWLDGDRVGALGASYGGYMINWIAGNWPDRFDALVNHDGIFDNRMMYYATEELWFPEWEHLGTPWENPEEYEKHNPLHHVDEWKTPMLVVQGALDFRVPETQALATFTALQRRGIPSKLLYFPDENHWVLSPANSILWHETVLDWLKEWVK